MSEKKQPNIRFQGFYGDWEKKEFLNAFDPAIPTNTLSRANLNYEQGAIKNIHYGDVLIKFGEITDVLKEEIPFITGADITKYKNQFLENGDIIFADAAEDETVGKATEISGITDEKVVSGLHTLACRPIDSGFTGYWGYYLNSSAYHNQLLPLMQGIKVLSISKRSLATTFVNYPNEENEQIKIGELFKELDNLIALNQSKFDKLINMKKSCLEKMFPKDGAGTPEIRFKGFSGKWEEKKLGEVAKLGSSKRVHREDYRETGVPFFRGLEISKLGSSSKINDLLYISFNHYNDLKEKYGVPKAGDILITAVGTIGNCYLIYDNKPFYFKDGNLIWISDIQVNSLFLSIYLNDAVGKKRVLDSAVGSNQKALTMIKLETVKVTLPGVKEQEKISAFFKNIDSLITLRKTELDKLKNIKKTLLEKMFI